MGMGLKAPRCEDGQGLGSRHAPRSFGWCYLIVWIDVYNTGQCHFVETTAELLSGHKAEVPNHSPLILDEVEGIWEEELRLKLSGFASMQNLEQAPCSEFSMVF